MLTAGKLSIIDINSLDRYRPATFNQTQFRRVKAAVQTIKPMLILQANLVVLPLSSYPDLFTLHFKPETLVKAEMSRVQARYAAYIKCLGDHLTLSLAPIFIFAAAPDRANIESWLNGLHRLTAPVIMVDSLGHNGTPWFEAGMTDKVAWDRLVKILKADLSIGEITLSGEKAYTVNQVRQGSVYDVADNLRLRSLSLKVEKELTFPNING